MPVKLPQSLTWSLVLEQLRECTGARVRLQDGRATQPADTVRIRPAAAGTEFCLFDGETAATRLALIDRLETLAKSPDRRFMDAAHASINGANLLIDAIFDESDEGVVWTTISTRRPKLGFGASQGKAPHTTGRTKRIKNG